MSKALARPKILLTDSLSPEVEARLGTTADMLRAERNDEASLLAVIRGCDALIARTHTPVSRRLLQEADRLRVVGVAGVGVDRVDLAAARERGIVVLNTPAAASDAAAEFTVTLMLNLLRPVPRLSRQYQKGEFAATRAKPHGSELRELTVGIVGMGRIGSRVGRICAAGFGAKVLYNDIRPVGPFEFAAEAVDKSTLWRESDIVSLHLPLTDDTRGLIDTTTLSQFRPDALLVNAARGAIVKTDDLTQALGVGRIAGAALDVTDPEPLPPEHPLFSFENCLLTPHVAARTFGGLQRMLAVADDVLAFLRGELSADCEQNAAR